MQNQEMKDIADESRTLLEGIAMQTRENNIEPALEAQIVQDKQI
jgi:hypothetical protein